MAKAKSSVVQGPAQKGFKSKGGGVKTLMGAAPAKNQNYNLRGSR